MNQYRRIYTNKGGKPVYIGCPVVANGEFALAYVKGDDCKTVSLKDILKCFEHPELLPHLKI